jgi:hypothetical protein
VADRKWVRADPLRAVGFQSVNPSHSPQKGGQAPSHQTETQRFLFAIRAGTRASERGSSGGIELWPGLFVPSLTHRTSLIEHLKRYVPLYCGPLFIVIEQLKRYVPLY